MRIAICKLPVTRALLVASCICRIRDYCIDVLEEAASNELDHKPIALHTALRHGK